MLTQQFFLVAYEFTTSFITAEWQDIIQSTRLILHPTGVRWDFVALVKDGRKPHLIYSRIKNIQEYIFLHIRLGFLMFSPSCARKSHLSPPTVRWLSLLGDCFCSILKEPRYCVNSVPLETGKSHLHQLLVKDSYNHHASNQCMLYNCIKHIFFCCSR